MAKQGGIKISSASISRGSPTGRALPVGQNMVVSAQDNAIIADMKMRASYNAFTMWNNSF